MTVSARQLAIEASVRALCEAEAESDDRRAKESTQRSLAWSAVAQNLHPDVDSSFIRRVRAEFDGGSD